MGWHSLSQWVEAQRNLPASHLVEFNHPPSFKLQDFAMNADPVDFLTVMVFVTPLSFQMAAMSDSPSPSKSPDTGFIRTKSFNFFFGSIGIFTIPGYVPITALSFLPMR